ncbi:MAG: MotA/TolQ/ExbB proton channel family protein [Myxococcales bacterium]|nr:MotA/TolQ/ExbB proton channel family protein [Myxococcales bacterium]
MELVDRLKLLLLGTGARPVLWALIGLSVASLAVILERAWVFYRTRSPAERVIALLVGGGGTGGGAGARARIEALGGYAARIAVAGLGQVHAGPSGVERAMRVATLIERKRLERRLAILATLGNNAPFVGLFGTVIGIIEAFEHLGSQAGGVPAGTSSAPVMSAIAEALVATAVGLAVAIPAVAAYNFFQRLVKSRQSDADVMAQVVTSHASAPGASVEGV